MEPAKNKQQKSTSPEQNVPVEVTVKNEPEKILFTWTAPARPFKRRNREFYITIVVMAVIVGLILFLAEGFMPVILLISLIFLFYVLNTVEPESVEYKITNKGIKVADKKTDWRVLTKFWFTKRYDSQLLIVGMVNIPGRMELVIKSGDKEKIKEILSPYIPEEETPPAFLDKAANWFSKRLPGNN